MVTGLADRAAGSIHEHRKRCEVVTCAVDRGREARTVIYVHFQHLTSGIDPRAILVGISEAWISNTEETKGPVSVQCQYHKPLTDPHLPRSTEYDVFSTNLIGCRSNLSIISSQLLECNQLTWPNGHCCKHTTRET
jgi:hypothetical protein